MLNITLIIISPIINSSRYNVRVMPPQDAESTLVPLRFQIDELDDRLVDLLNERARVVVEIGRVKQDGQTAIYAPGREQQVLRRIGRHNQGPLPDSCLQAIWRELMSGSFALERPLKIGYLGPPGSHSHLVARKKFGVSVAYQDVDHIQAVFEEIARGHIDLGLVPIENSAQGGIGETLDVFLGCCVKVCAEVLIGVQHNLLAACKLDEITAVHSKPQALSQCRQWLTTHLPKVARIPAASTSKAAELAAQQRGVAAVGSTLAGEIYHLNVLARHIEDNPHNVTRFFVIGNQSPPATGDDKTALMFTTAHETGALANVLDVFRQYALNLTHIDKRPSPQTNWEYFFFVDFEGHQDDESVIKAIEAARKHCLQLTVLGSFPRSRQVL